MIKEEHHVPSKGWAEMIRKAYEVDPLVCPECGGEMKIISFIVCFPIFIVLSLFCSD
jgi:hypothetical protein